MQCFLASSMIGRRFEPISSELQCYKYGTVWLLGVDLPHAKPIMKRGQVLDESRHPGVGKEITRLRCI